MLVYTVKTLHYSTNLSLNVTCAGEFEEASSESLATALVVCASFDITGGHSFTLKFLKRVLQALDLLKF